MIFNWITGHDPDNDDIISTIRSVSEVDHSSDSEGSVHGDNAAERNKSTRLVSTIESQQCKITVGNVCKCVLFLKNENGNDFQIRKYMYIDFFDIFTNISVCVPSRSTPRAGPT